MSKVYHPRHYTPPIVSSTSTKQCRICQKIFAATPDNFYRDRWHKDGLGSACRDCDYKQTYKKDRPPLTLWKMDLQVDFVGTIDKALGS